MALLKTNLMMYQNESGIVFSVVTSITGIYGPTTESGSKRFSL